MERIPCDPERECKLRDTIGCFEDLDHLASPRRSYRTQLEKQFRDLPENKQITCRQLHNERHATEGHKDKPTEEEMVRAVMEYKLSQEVLRIVA